MVGNKDLRFPQQHHPLPRLHKLQTGIMTGDMGWQFPGIYRSETQDYDGRQGLVMSRDHGQHHPVTNLQKVNGRILS